MQSFWTVASVSPSVHTAHAILVSVYVCMSATSSFLIASVMSIRVMEVAATLRIFTSLSDDTGYIYGVTLHMLI